ncbi:MAG: hemerythrin family protein [Nitrosomonadales bacterium]|nr:hemerythrin family protein [Nitrosomonadales bacterium]
MQMQLIWTRKLSVGNAVIDSEHRNLISMARDVMHEIRNGDAASLLQAVDLLESWLHIHFANEERIARAVGFDFDRHDVGQQYLLKEFQRIRNELTAKNVLWSGGATKYFSRHLKNWLIDEHIIRLDMRMKPALQSFGYGFLPAGENSAARLAQKKEANKPLHEFRANLPSMPPQKAFAIRNAFLLTPPAIPIARFPVPRGID